MQDDEHYINNSQETQIIPSGTPVKSLTVKMNGKEVIDIDEAEAFLLQQHEEEQEEEANLVAHYEKIASTSSSTSSSHGLERFSPMSEKENSQLSDFFCPHFPIPEWNINTTIHPPLSPPHIPPAPSQPNTKLLHKAEKTPRRQQLFLND